MKDKDDIRTYTEFYALIDYLATLPHWPVVNGSQCSIDYSKTGPVSATKRALIEKKYGNDLWHRFCKPVLRVFNVLTGGKWIAYIDRTQCSDKAIVGIINSHFSNVKEIKNKRTGAILYQGGNDEITTY